MGAVKLSELPDETQVSLEDTNATYTVEELKREILELNEPHHLASDWYMIKDATWTPSASSMLEDYIDSCRDDMYEDWDERATDCVTEEYTQKIQVILEEMFESARGYWEYEKKVEIDIFPPKK